MKKLFSVFAAVLIIMLLCSCSSADRQLMDTLTGTDWVMYKITDGEMEFSYSTMGVFGYSGSVVFSDDGTYVLRRSEAVTTVEEGVFTCSGKTMSAEMVSESGSSLAVYEDGILIVTESDTANGYSVWFVPADSDMLAE